MKLVILSLLLLLFGYAVKAQPSVVLDTVAILQAQKALEQAKILYSTEHVNYAKASLELSSLYMQDWRLIRVWEDVALDALAKIREDQGSTSTLYQWGLNSLPPLLSRLFDSQLALEEAEQTKDSDPIGYAESLLWRAKIFLENRDLEAYDLPVAALEIVHQLPPKDRAAVETYAKRYINPYILTIAQAHAAMNLALKDSQPDSLALAEKLWQYGASVINNIDQLPLRYADMESVYFRLTQALHIYEQQLGTNSARYQQTYRTLTPVMANFYAVEKLFLERLRQHKTNDNDFIVLFRKFLTLLIDDYVSTYDELDVFEWVLEDIEQQHGINDPYYTIVQAIKKNLHLTETEQEIAIQEDLVQSYRLEYGLESQRYLEASIELGNLEAERGYDLKAETAYHQAFDQLELMEERGVASPVEDNTLLQYYWKQVLPTWRVVLIKEHNLHITQQAYGLQSPEYWNAYFDLVVAHKAQDILGESRGSKYLITGLRNLPKAYTSVAFPWVDTLLKMNPEYNLNPIIPLLLPKVFSIPQLEALLRYPLDSLTRQYSSSSVEVGQLLEVLADAYFYDTTKVEHAAIALERYQNILDRYQTIGDDYMATLLLDRITQNITQFSPWTFQQVDSFFKRLLNMKADDDYYSSERDYLTYVERYADWLYSDEQLVASEQYYERIVDYFERENPDYLLFSSKEENNAWYLRTLDKLASIYRKTGRHYKALNSYKKLYKLAPELNADPEESAWMVVRAINDIGDLFYRTEQYDEALECFNLTLSSIERLKKSYPIFDRNKKAGTALLYVAALSNKGRVYFDLEDVPQARFYYTKALNFLENSKTPITLNDANFLLLYLADLAVYDYQDEQAEQYYRQALSVIRDKEAVATINLAFAEYYQVIGQDSLAATHFLNALSIDLTRVQENYTALAEKERQLFLTPILKRFDTFVEFAVRYNNPELLLKAFNSHLIIKGLSLETTNNLQSVCQVTENTVLRKKCLEMQRLRKELSSSTDLPLDVQNNLDTRITNLEKEIGLSSKDLREIYDKNNRNLDFVDLKRILYNMDTPDDLTVAIDFLLIPETDDAGFRENVYYAAVVIPHHPYPHFVRLATEREFSDVLAANVTPSSFNYITAASESQYLYQLVWEPLLPHLNNAKYLHLCPTGILSRISFGTLQTGHYASPRIMDRWSIHYYGALRDLLTLKTDNGLGASASAVLVGGVKFDLTPEDIDGILAHMAVPSAPALPNTIQVGARGEDFNYLAGTLREVQMISRKFPSDWVVKLLSGTLATEENVSELANEGPDILHIATHGYFFPTPSEKSLKMGASKNKKGIEDNLAAAANPLLRSGLALAGINRMWKGEPTIEGLEDGILTALEVSNLDLFNTKLVVLSACETGRGDIDNTEGILGLRRAFKMAGAQQLLISLWKVPDAQTAELMQLFYQQYLRRTSAHAAFEYAQQEMRKRYQNPYYWAAFLLIE